MIKNETLPSYNRMKKNIITTHVSINGLECNIYTKMRISNSNLLIIINQYFIRKSIDYLKQTLTRKLEVVYY
jgi:hypothetical protein